MNIRRLRINNILSFGPYEESQALIEVKEHDLTILIGSNGSGKSNILTIINTYLKQGLHYDYTMRIRNGEYYISRRHHDYHISTHHHYHQLPSSLTIEIQLHQHDRDNLLFIHTHRDELTAMSRMYGEYPLHIPHSDIQHINTYNQISLRTTIRNGKFEDEQYNNNDTYLVYCLHHLEYIQHLITLHNLQKTGSDTISRPALKQSHALLGSYRDSSYRGPYAHITTPQQLSELIETISQPTSDIHHGRSSTSRILLQHKLLQDQQSKTDTVTSAVQSLCQTYLSGSLIMQPLHDNLYQGALRDDSGHTIDINTLSSGEKSLLHIISTIFGYDLQDGLLLIDEPELHLHPQGQQDCISLLQTLSAQQGIQSIIATHSPLMITPHTINGVLRCYRNQDRSAIRQPSKQFDEDDGLLFQMLRFSHLAKIFFVDTIILVEGDTDEYFLGHYMDYLKYHTSRGDRITNYEIMNINGKGSYHRRKKFLSAFGIQCFYIGDRDNIIQELPHLPREQLRQQSLSSIKKTPGHHSPRSKSQKYSDLITYIQSHHPRIQAQINQRLHILRQSGIYILSQGDIEAYLGLKHKGIEPTVTFCLQGGFEQWLKDSHFDSKREELEKMIQDMMRS